MPGPEIVEPTEIRGLLALGATTTAVPPLCIAEKVKAVEAGIDALVLILNVNVVGGVNPTVPGVTAVTVVPGAIPVPETVCPI